MFVISMFIFINIAPCLNLSTLPDNHTTMLITIIVTFIVWTKLMFVIDQFTTFTIENADAMRQNELVPTICAFAVTFAGYPMIHNLFVDSIPIPVFTLYTMVNWWIWMGIAFVILVLILDTHLPKKEDS